MEDNIKKVKTVAAASGNHGGKRQKKNRRKTNRIRKVCAAWVYSVASGAAADGISLPAFAAYNDRNDKMITLLV